MLEQEEAVASSLKQQREKSAVQIRLLKGPLYRARHRDLWTTLERDQFQIREFFQQIGLSLTLDDAEGYAFVRQQDWSEEDIASGLDLPRLITRRQLSFSQTLLLVALRKRLAEHDSEESSPRLIVTRHEMHQWLLPYSKEVSNEIKQHKEFDALIRKVSDMGFISALLNHKDDFEVQRILKAFVSAEQIIAFNQVLEDYLAEQEENT